MKLKDYRKNLVERAADPDYVAAYLTAVLAKRNQAAFLAALKDVVDARVGMTQVAVDTGIARPSLYKVLSQRGNPTLQTLREILGALGLRLSVAAA